MKKKVFIAIAAFLLGILFGCSIFYILNKETFKLKEAYRKQYTALKYDEYNKDVSSFQLVSDFNRPETIAVVLIYKDAGGDFPYSTIYDYLGREFDENGNPNVFNPIKEMEDFLNWYYEDGGKQIVDEKYEDYLEVTKAYYEYNKAFAVELEYEPDEYDYFDYRFVDSKYINQVRLYISLDMYNETIDEKGENQENKLSFEEAMKCMPSEYDEDGKLSILNLPTNVIEFEKFCSYDRNLTSSLISKRERYLSGKVSDFYEKCYPGEKEKSLYDMSIEELRELIEFATQAE